MTHDTATVAVPVRFAGMDVLVQASAVSVAGSEPTSAADRVRDAYQRAEPAVLGMARSLAGTVDRLVDEGAHPRTVEVEVRPRRVARRRHRGGEGYDRSHAQGHADL